MWPYPLLKKFATKFSKKEGRGSKAVWNFSKNSSDLVAGSFPYLFIFFSTDHHQLEVLEEIYHDIQKIEEQDEDYPDIVEFIEQLKIDVKYELADNNAN